MKNKHKRKKMKMKMKKNKKRQNAYKRKNFCKKLAASVVLYSGIPPGTFSGNFNSSQITFF